MRRPVHRLRNLQAFLAEVPQPEKSEPSGLSLILVIVCSMLILAGASIGGASSIELSFLTVAVVIAGFMVSAHLTQVFETPVEKWTPDALLSRSEIQRLNENGTLEHKIDPEVGDLLDECAAKYLILDRLLKSSEWISAKDAKLEAKRAAEAALTLLMGDALVISLSGIQANALSLDQFKERMETPSVKDPILQSLIQVSTQMDLLQDEFQFASNMPEEPDAFREAIVRISEIRKAEEELHQHLRGS